MIIDPLSYCLLGQSTQRATGAAAPAPASTGGFDVVDGVMLVLAAVALAAIVLRNVWKPTAILGPPRVRRLNDIILLAAALFAGAVVWMGTPLFFFSWLNGARGPSGHIDLNKLAAMQTAVLATVPYLMGMAALLLADLLFRRDIPLELGYSGRRLPAGLLKGLLAFIVVMPIMYWAMVGAEWVYHQFQFEHPREIDLMRAMNQGGISRILLVFGATVLAPIFEELFFRGHLQTILRGFLVWMAEQIYLSLRRPAPAAMAGEISLEPAPPPAPAMLGYESPPASPVPGYEPQPAPPVLSRGVEAMLVWVAILVTSLLFASLHEAWSAPMIFVLAVCLGYVYERTGNLWACITIHALFNIAETALYLGGAAH